MRNAEKILMNVSKTFNHGYGHVSEMLKCNTSALQEWNVNEILQKWYTLAISLNAFKSIFFVIL